MQIYLVGGAVRDALLGREVKDRDWVVVGADTETMLAAGFQAVGRDFPVFLHPHSHEEYALARTERKTAKGYTGFEVSAGREVSLEQDLMRRDLTVNAMAQTQDGKLIDPFGGQADLAAGILRHVSSAFAEDPVRILRTARFAARYGFAVADETMVLMRQMVADGEADALVAERVWQEWAKGLTEDTPQQMVAVLRRCGILPVLLPEADDAAWAQAENLLVRAAGLDLAERYALMTSAWNGDVVRALNRRWRVPKACAELADLTCRFQAALREAADAETMADILQQTDALRRPQRFTALLNVCAAVCGSDALKTRWLNRLVCVQAVDTAAIARAYHDRPAQIAAAIRAQRVRALVELSDI